MRPHRSGTLLCERERFSRPADSRGATDVISDEPEVLCAVVGAQ